MPNNRPLSITLSSEPNGIVSLGDQDVVLRTDSHVWETSVAASLHLAPEPRLVFTATIDAQRYADAGAATLSTVAVEFQSGANVACHVVSAPFIPFEDPVTLLLSPSGGDTLVGDPDSRVQKVIFAIPNFPRFLAKGIIREVNGGFKREDQIELTFGPWQVTIRSTPDAKEHLEVLSREGGYALTAWGDLRRGDADAFTFRAADDVLRPLHVMLSFACGRWTGPLLATGIDASGSPICQRWSVPLISRGTMVNTWFDLHHGTALGEIFPGFMTKWADPAWKETISRTIYWFVRANSNAAGADGSLILIQAALENLSWTTLVKDRHLLSKSKFKSLNAGEKIRHLLEALDVPTDVPAGLPQLVGEVAARGWTDGCDGIASVRNDLVHPEKHGGQIPIVDCWLLAQRFLELSLLRLFDYVGPHGNRAVIPRWIGQVDPVPWAHTKSPAPTA